MPQPLTPDAFKAMLDAAGTKYKTHNVLPDGYSPSGEIEHLALQPNGNQPNDLYSTFGLFQFPKSEHTFDRSGKIPRLVSYRTFVDQALGRGGMKLNPEPRKETDEVYQEWVHA